jgi:hypothetical protein
MSTINIQLPDSLHSRARQMAEQDHISLDQFIALALAEKLSALLTEDYLKERALRGDRAKFLNALSKVPDQEPEEHDRL